MAICVDIARLVLIPNPKKASMIHMALYMDDIGIILVHWRDIPTT